MAARESKCLRGVMNRRTWLLAGVFLLLFATPAKADNRIIVRTTLGLQGLQQLCLLQSCNVVGALGDPLSQVFLVATPLDPTIFLSLVRALPGIVDAELDQLLSLVGGLNRVTTPPAALSDAALITYYNSTVWNGYANQPAAQKVRVSTAQNQFQVTGSGIVADIDTGVDPNHPALKSILLPGYDFTRNQPGASELNDLSPTDFPSTPSPCPPSTCPPATVNQSSAAILDQSSAAILDTNPKYAAFGHGTMVMGVIHLVAPKANLLPLKAFRSNGTGFLSDILRAIYYAVQNKANVINMSFDFPTNSSELASALDSANQSALICAASAGNDGQKEIVYPAALQSVVMGVASTSALDTRSSFSNYGNAIVWVAAPGEGIVTAYPFGTYAAGWGTSFSAPFVSGASALLLNKQAKTNESQAAAAVAHAVPVGPDMGNGRLDVVQALQALSPQDFSLSATSTSSTINAGQSATYTLTVSPSGGFNQTVTLTCSGFPPASTCVVTPPAVTLDGTNPASATVVIQTTARASAPPAVPLWIVPLPFVEALWRAWLLVWVVWLLYVPIYRFGRRSRQRPDFATAVGLLSVLLCSYSCGGGGSYSGAPTPQPQPQPQGSATTLSSVTLNPTSVNGGNPSTGKVTLSGPAPSGGAVVSLSSSNTSAAAVPPSVTVVAGATSAAFQVTTVPSPNSVQVTISASSGGVTQTASLTVTPQPPSGPTLMSIALNPSSVIGGSPSSGTVTLSAPAPSGGALVSLSSSSAGVVTVPSNVTIPAGATSATFIASSSSVTVSTAVTVSGSYAGVTQTASLTVTPAPPPGTPAGTYTITIMGTSGNLSHNTTVKLVVN
jgi:Subtilase family